MKTATLFIYTSLLLGFSAVSFAQNLFKPESILIYSTMSMEDGLTMDLATFTKEQKFIRGSIYTDKKLAGAIISYNGESIGIHEKMATPTPPRALSGDDAASNLVDLIALNPDYHFREKDGFNFNIHIFNGYRVELLREDAPIEGTEIYLPTALKLYKKVESDERLIRSIQYSTFFEQLEPYIQPKKLTLVDEATGEEGHIFIDSVHYNAGLPDFLFVLPYNK